jgi:hypothetical protein
MVAKPFSFLKRIVLNFIAFFLFQMPLSKAYPFAGYTEKQRKIRCVAILRNAQPMIVVIQALELQQCTSCTNLD